MFGFDQNFQNSNIICLDKGAVEGREVWVGKGAVGWGWKVWVRNREVGWGREVWVGTVGTIGTMVTIGPQGP